MDMQLKRYPVSEAIEFGEALIRTGDLDPVYIAIHGANLPVDQLKRLLLAYWCFYSLGASAWLSEWKGVDFWDKMLLAARNDRSVPPSMDDLPAESWPRGTERRHFRGKKCVDAINWLARQRGGPEDLIDYLSEGKTLAGVSERIQKWPMFGGWVAFKAADLIERVLGVPIQFPDDLALFYKEPRAGLDMIFYHESSAEDLATKDTNIYVRPETMATGDQAKIVLEALRHWFVRFPAPPRNDRACNIQEIETLACKFHSHKRGFYPIGKDIREVRHGLKGWGATADKLLAACPPEVPHDRADRSLF
jgi:hypothetical protein